MDMLMVTGQFKHYKIQMEILSPFKNLFKFGYKVVAVVLKFTFTFSWTLATLRGGASNLLRPIIIVRLVFLLLALKLNYLLIWKEAVC